MRGFSSRRVLETKFDMTRFTFTSRSKIKITCFQKFRKKCFKMEICDEKKEFSVEHQNEEAFNTKDLNAISNPASITSDIDCNI